MIWWLKYRYYRRFGPKGKELLDQVRSGKDVKVVFENLHEPLFVNRESFKDFHYLFIRNDKYGNWEIE